MPNHITTNIRIMASGEVQEAIIEFLHTPGPKDEDDAFNFDCNKLVLRPPELDVPSKTDNSEDELKVLAENLEKFGHETWYSWSIENWGTKWGTYESSYSEGVISFQTAWSHPVPIMKKLFEKYPGVLFEVEYASDDTGQNLGKYNSEDQKNTGPLQGSQEAVAFALRVWGESIEEYVRELSEDVDEEDQNPEFKERIAYLRSQISV